MSAGVRWVLVIVLAIVLVVSLAVGGAVAAIYGGGRIAVDVWERGGSTKIGVGVPAGLADLAIAWVPIAALPVDEVAPLAEELRPYGPAARAALDELARLPDFVLVEVEGPDQHVVVKKVGKRMLVVVDADGTRVRVSVPLATARKFLRKLDRVIDRT